MTLVVAAFGRRSVWLLTDRRISFRDRPAIDDACKVVHLDAEDGIALLGYAGLGSTAAGMQPSEWMATSLRGRTGSVEQCLGLLTAVAERELPPHLVRLRSGHGIVAATIVSGEPRLYTIKLSAGVVSFDRQIRTVAREGLLKPPSFCVAGSGASLFVERGHDKLAIKKLIQAHDSGHVSPTTVARYLASLNHAVHKQTATVGPGCIVSWRVVGGGGGQECFDGDLRVQCPAIPAIARGTDLRALVSVMLKHIRPSMAAGLEATKRGEKTPPVDVDKEQINAELSSLPSDPDETLR